MPSGTYCREHAQRHCGGIGLNKPLVVILLVLIAGTFSISFLMLRPTNTNVAPSTTATNTNTVRITLRGVELIVELAKTPNEQKMGLSGRDSMPQGHGMLFVFETESRWGFWMNDMRFSLDIIWFDSNRQVVFIEQNLQPCSPQSCPTYVPTANALYVLEVNAGFVQVHGVALGDTFNFVG